MTEMQRRLFPWALLIGAFSLRAPALASGLWFDEIWLLSNIGSQSLGETLTTFKSDNNHPLYSILSWFSVQAFDGGPISLRLVAVLFGSLSVVAAYHLAAALLPHGTAVVLSLALMVSSHHIAFSTNARGYTALLFFSLSACFWFHRDLRGDHRYAWWRCAIALALASFVHLTGVFLSVGLLVAALIDRRRASVRILFLAGALSLLLHAPLLRQMLAFFRRDRPEVAAGVSWTDPFWALGEVFQSFGVSWSVGLIGLLGALGVGVVGCRALWKSNRWFVVATLVSPTILLCFLLAMGRNIWPRLFFCFAGLVFLIGLQGAAVLSANVSGRVRHALSIALLVGCAWGVPVVWTVPPQDFPAAAEGALALARPTDRIVTVGLAGFPYEPIYPQRFQHVETVDELNELRAEADRLLVLYTFPVHLQSRHVALWELLAAEATELSRTAGRAGGGALVLLSVPGRD